MGDRDHAHTQEACISPRDGQVQVQKDKSALELSVILVSECWNLFENVWTMRNDIFHRTDSAGAKIASKHLTEELLCRV